MEKIGLALSGGGIKGAAHIGVLRALMEMGVGVDMVSGSSAGSIVTAMLAAGRSLDEMETFALTQKPTVLDYDLWGLGCSLLGRFVGRPGAITGVVKGSRLHKRFLQATRGMTLSQAMVPVAIPAVDLISGDTVYFISHKTPRCAGLQCRYIDEGLLADAVSASVAIPIVFASRFCRGMQLVDGGVLENVPVNVLYRLGADTVIAVDLGARQPPEQKVCGLVEVGIHTLNTIQRRLVELRTVRAKVIIAPDVVGIGTFDFDKIPLCIERGYEAAMKAQDWIKNVALSAARHHEATATAGASS